MTTETLSAPPGLKGLVVAATRVGDVRGTEGFFHYRQYDATELARARSFESIAHLLLGGVLPDPKGEDAFCAELGAHRSLSTDLQGLADRLAEAGHSSLAGLRAVLSVACDPRPTLDMSATERRQALLAAIGATPTVLARIYRRQLSLPPIEPDGGLSHASDYVRMLTGKVPSAVHARAVETYLALTADHGFNASTFASRVITSTGADVGGILCGAVAALSGPLHGGAPSRVLDMLNAIGDPANTESWATRELAKGGKIMGFGHAVYRADDPRNLLLREVALDLGGELVDRAIEIEGRMLAHLRAHKPKATIVTNVEYYAAIVLFLAGVPQEMFTATFTTSRIVGWAAHILEQAADNKIMRPAARYVGEPAPQPLPRTVFGG